MLNLLDRLTRQAAEANVPVSVCGEAASRPLEAMTFAALGISTLSMPASSLLPVKAMLASLDLPAFRAVLTSLRQNADGEASLREPIAAWAREHGVVI
jgi:phosphotransferase system enzyme I (PtsP)